MFHFLKNNNNAIDNKKLKRFETNNAESWSLL